MLPMIYLCMAVSVGTHCIRIQESGPGVSPMQCQYMLQMSWLTVWAFKKTHPQFKDYWVAHKECTYDRVNSKEI